jgi:hypothetical protein
VLFLINLIALRDLPWYSVILLGFLDFFLMLLAAQILAVRGIYPLLQNSIDFMNQLSRFRREEDEDSN